MKKNFLKILLVVFLVSCFPFSINADVGPKPSVKVTIIDAPEGNYYVTLLCDEERFGPWSRISNEEAQDLGTTDEEKEAVLAFMNYRDADGYHFMGYFDECSKKEAFNWGYYAPKRFKIAIYSVDDQSLKISEAFERDAFEASYEVQYGDTLKVNEISNLGRRLLLFAMRVLVTFAIEMVLALLFNLRSKKHLLTIFIVNLITQVTLNIAMMILEYSSGGFVWVILFPICELLITIFELILYLIMFKDRPKWLIIIYTLLANGITMYLGMISGFIS